MQKSYNELLEEYILNSNFKCLMESPKKEKIIMDIQNTSLQNKAFILDVLVAHAIIGCDTTEKYCGIQNFTNILRNTNLI